MNFGPFTKTLATTYRANGQKASLAYPNGDTVSFQYDAGSQLQSITTPGGEIAFQYQHGQPIRVTLPGASKTLTYDALQRPSRILLEQGAAGSGVAVLDTRYSYDAVSDNTARETQEGTFT